MNESNSFLDSSTHEDPNSSQVPSVITHTQDTEKFLAYVKGRREAFEYASEMLRSHSENLAILMKQFEQSVLNNRPLEKVKKMTHSLIDWASSEIIDILQPPPDRPVSRSAASTSTKHPQEQMDFVEGSQYDDQPELDAAAENEQKLDCAAADNSQYEQKLVEADVEVEPLAASQLSDQEPLDRVVQPILGNACDQKEKRNADPKELTTSVVQCVNEFLDIVPAALEYGDEDVAKIAQYQEVNAESCSENAGQDQDRIEDKVQSATRNVSVELDPVVHQTGIVVSEDIVKQNGLLADDNLQYDQEHVKTDIETEPVAASQLPDQEPSDSTIPKELTTDVVQCVNELMSIVATAVGSGAKDVAEIVQYQGLSAESYNENAGQEQDGIEDEVQSALTDASSKYGDILTCSWKEFFERVPWLRYIISEVKQKRRWKSMSDLDEFRKTREKEEEEKAKKEEEARIVEERRVSIAKRIKDRSEWRMHVFMYLKIDHVFNSNIILARGLPPFPPSLNEFMEYLMRNGRGGGRGVSVNVDRFLSKRIKNSSHPEVLSFYNRILELEAINPNSEKVNCFVRFMHNKWKTGRVLKAKEFTFLKELSQWLEDIWRATRDMYLISRRAEPIPKWAFKGSYEKYLNVKCPKYFQTDFFKSRMQFHMLNEDEVMESDVMALHYEFLAKEAIDSDILDRDFHFIANECGKLKDKLADIEKALFKEQLGLQGNR